MKGIGILGLDAYPVQIKAHSVPGRGMLTIEHIEEARTIDARHRITHALSFAGVDLKNHIFIKLTPPRGMRAEDLFGPHLDLPIALAAHILDRRHTHRVRTVTGKADLIAFGHLSPEGRLCDNLRGGFLAAEWAATRGGLIGPSSLSRELGIGAGGAALVAEHLSEVLDHIILGTELRRAIAPEPEVEGSVIDWSDLCGNEAARRALEIAAAGGFSVALRGKHGSGATMIARRFNTIRPRLSPKERRQQFALSSVSGLRTTGARPFRCPHHSVSHAALFGGGPARRPGEVSLAHDGTLYLDEVIEFDRLRVTDLARLRTHKRVVLSRTQNTTTVAYPADFALLGSFHPCPCSDLICTCPPNVLNAYDERVEKYLRLFDLIVDVDPFSARAGERAEASSIVRERVEAAQASARAATPIDSIMHAAMRAVDAYRSTFGPPAGDLLRPDTLIAEVAVTIARLEGEQLAPEHIVEAIGLMPRTAASRRRAG